MADRRIVVDPVTRIEGHLRVQAVIGDNNVIRDAKHGHDVARLGSDS